jgi:hypothetical protein
MKHATCLALYYSTTDKWITSNKWSQINTSYTSRPIWQQYRRPANSENDGGKKWYKKFWQELIYLSLHKLTVNNLVTMEHKQSKPNAERGSANNVEHQ